METNQQTTNEVKVLVQLLLGSGLVTREEFARANEMSVSENIPLLKAVSETGYLPDDSISLSQQAQQKVLANEISSDLAIRAMRIALQRKMSLPDAIASVQRLHQATQVSVSVTNELTNLLLAAKFITPEDLGRFIKLSSDSGMMIGHLLLLDNKISTDELLGALNAVVMGRENTLNKNNAAQGLRYARQRTISFERALFELDFLHPHVNNMRMSELFLLAGLLTREDLAECFEIELFKNKPFGQILLERGLVTAHQVQSATVLMAKIHACTMKPYEAAEALFSVVKEGLDVEAAAAAVTSNKPDVIIPLGDLLVEAGVCGREVVYRVIPDDSKSWGEQGSALFKAAVLEEEAVITSLRLKALIGLGFLRRDKAVFILSYCVRERAPLESAFANLGVHVPSRMQWTWIKSIEPRTVP